MRTEEREQTAGISTMGAEKKGEHRGAEGVVGERKKLATSLSRKPREESVFIKGRSLESAGDTDQRAPSQARDGGCGRGSLAAGGAAPGGREADGVRGPGESQAAEEGETTF